MRIDILTLFPEMFTGPLTESILKRAQEQGFLDLRIHNIRDYSALRHRQVDEKPYGGGAGMVMMCEPVVRAIEAVTNVMENGKWKMENDGQIGSGVPMSGMQQQSSAAAIRTSLHSKNIRPWCIYLSASGKKLTQPRVEKLAKREWILLLCGHYEGIDQRIIDGWIDEEVSIGDYVLTGGELPAMVLVDAVARQIPGVIGKESSVDHDSFSKVFDRRREYPHYTRPEEFRGMKVPDVLLSGHHENIEEWRTEHLR